jgi:hypothetical protein
MEESIKIQEEFENLITQLERLRNINELTSANADTAQLVISKIESFIQSTNEFKNKINQDIEQKTTSIQRLIESLSETIDNFDNQSINLRDDLNSTIDGFKRDANLKFQEIDGSLNSQIEKVYNETKSLKDLLSNILVEMQSNIVQILNYNSEIQQNKLGKETEALKSNIENQGKEIKSLKDVFSSKSLEMKSNIVQVLNYNSEIQQNKLGKETEALKSIIENQGKEIKSLKNIMIIIGLLIVIEIIIIITLK